MKKTYTRCSASLFIGLLSLHTLSSCVNTGQTLGIIEKYKDKKLKRALDKQDHALIHTKGQLDEYCHYCKPIIHESTHIPKSHSMYPNCRHCKPWYTKTLYQAATGITTTALVGAGLFYYYMPSTSDLMEGTAANATTALASTVGTAVANMTNTTLASIGQTAATVAAVTTTTLLPTAGLIASLRPNGWNSNSSVATSLIPEGFTTPMSNTPTEAGSSIINATHIPGGHAMDTTKSSNIKPIELSHKVMDDIIKNNFSKERIEYWVANGLSIDASDANGISLLMAAVRKEKEEAVKFIISQKADVNAQDNHGNTALLYAIHTNKKTGKKSISDTSKRIVDYLIKNKANPCIKNIYDASFASDIESLSDAYSKKLLEAMQRCKQ